MTTRVNSVQPIEGVAGGQAVPVSGTVTATVDTSALATSAKQDTAAATLSQIAGATVPVSATGVVTKSDSTTYSPPLRYLCVTGAGDVALVLSGSANVITVPMAANEKLTCFLISKVMSAGTTATGISGAS